MSPAPNSVNKIGNNSRVGAYGLRVLSPSPIPTGRLMTVPQDWLDWSFTSGVVSPDEAVVDLDDSALHVGPDTARMPLQPSGWVDVDRAGTSSHFTLDHELTGEELVHPAMASTAAVVAWWTKRVALHGAAIRDPADGRAIAFVGSRESGKSSSILGLATRGWQPVSDDVLVIDRTSVLAGPRIVDLRETTATAWQLGTNVGRLGRRERWRVVSPAVPAAVPLKAIVRLAWGDELRLEAVRGAERFAAVSGHLVLPMSVPDPAALLRLVSVPLLTLIRPRDLSAIDVALDAVLAGIDEPRQRGLHQ